MKPAAKPAAGVAALRLLRVLHRWVGVPLMVFILISSLTGILLGWKKEVAWIQPPTMRGEVPGLDGWRPLPELVASAQLALAQHLGEADPSAFPVDRLDIRPDRGIAKVLFVQGWWEVQIDGVTGQTLYVARRHSDLIEQIHDGSIISDAFKLIAMNGLGIGLVLLSLSGLWLWWGPIRVRRQRQRDAAA
jgi:uncharacterized iron-regulated membrane protein